MVDMEQLWLPTKKGGVGIPHLTALDASVCTAGFLAAAALAQQALVKAPVASNPSKGSLGGRENSCGSSCTLHAHAMVHACVLRRR
jgi:hypothetical protein